MDGFLVLKNFFLKVFYRKYERNFYKINIIEEFKIEVIICLMFNLVFIEVFFINSWVLLRKSFCI